MNGRNNPTNQEDSSGSPDKGEPVFVVIGKLRRSHGLQGDMLMEVLTDFPDRLQPGSEVYTGEEHQVLQIQRIRWHGKLLRIAFVGLDNPESVGMYRNTYIYALTKDSPTLPEDEYYHHQLIGLNVVNENGVRLGVLDQILETGANEVFLIKDKNGKEILLPVIDQVVLDIDLDIGEIQVHILSGLIPE